MKNGAYPFKSTQNAYSGRYPFTNSGDIRSINLVLQFRTLVGERAAVLLGTAVLRSRLGDVRATRHSPLGIGQGKVAVQLLHAVR